ncbi:MAG: Rieske 2Fe-2S domain-containing protein [Actinobacteria bacterium]|nr:Rieske 2Fe-2S domain-containing protein [Actinomycetota bacterium]
MRITGTGHASVFIETSAGSILCDPWVNPAYFASWFPFPDNSELDWERMGACDYLYISHLHRDHFDAEHLRRYVPKNTTVLFPDFPTTSMETELKDLGFTDIRRMPNEEVVDLDGINVMIQAMTAPTDGPLGDSSIWVEDNGIRLLNQNDARPAELTKFAELGEVHAHLLQFSGAIWYPMVYELPPAAKAAFGQQKRERQLDRSLRYIEDLNAKWVFPIAGPPCFLDEELFGVNDVFGDEGNIFPDQQVFVDFMAEQGHDNGIVLLPGTEATMTRDSIEVSQPIDDVPAFFERENKLAYLRDYQARQRETIELERKSWSHPEMDVFAVLQERVEPIMEQADQMSHGIGGPVLYQLTEPTPENPDPEIIEEVVFDFVERKVRRPLPEDKPRYRFRLQRRLIEHLLYVEEEDWVNHLFLSCRFSTKRIGQYNEFVYTFFKALTDERVNYVEGWYAEQQPDAEDIELDGWVVQRRCPHLKADLTRFGKIEDGVLQCMLHGWKFDLESGRCLTSAGHEIRATKEASSEA